MQNEINAKIFKRNLGNAAVVRILDLLDLIQSEPAEVFSTLDFWNRLMHTYFFPTLVIRFTTAGNNSSQESFGISPKSPRQYELDMTTAPQFFLMNLSLANVAKYQVMLPNIKFQVMNSGSVFFTSKFRVIVNYGDGLTGTLVGTCRILLGRDLRIEWVDCKCLDYLTSMSMEVLQNHWRMRTVKDESGANSGDIFERLLGSAQANKAIPNSGLSENAMRILLISDVMFYLKPLVDFSLNNNINSPLKALETFMAASSGSHLQRMSSISGKSGAVSSPSPLSSVPEDTKKPPKKRRLSTVANSPSTNLDRRT